MKCFERKYLPTVMGVILEAPAKGSATVSVSIGEGIRGTAPLDVEASASGGVGASSTG
jgi:hypothetical protein